MFAMSVCVIIAHPIGYLTIVAMITRGVIRRLSDCHSIGQHEALEAVSELAERGNHDIIVSIIARLGNV